MEVILVLIGLALFVGLPILVLVLWGKVSTLEDQVRRLTTVPRQAQPSTTATASAPVVPPPMPAAPAAVPVAPAAPLAAAKPVERPSQPATSPAPEVDVFSGLRDMGLLPPTDLKGEFALGSWWAVRIGGTMAVATVVFLGIWLNLRSTLPAWVRLAEIVLLGCLALWGGLRLERTRRDLGRIVFAVGLTVFQFAAWATYGMEKMRVLETSAQAAVLQFFVAMAVGAVALARKDKLIGQLSLAFTTVAVALSIQAGAEALTIGLEAASIAALGAILLARGGWASSAVLGLLGAVIGLLALYARRPVSNEVSLAVQVGAGLSFLALWLADRFGRVESTWNESQKNLFLCAAFFAPGVLGIWVAVGGDEGRFLASLSVALLALLVGALELKRRPAASEIILASALVFAAAAGAWKVEQRMVWAVWLLSAALAQLLYARFRTLLLVWLAEALVIAGCVAFGNQSPSEPWMRLLAPACVALLAAWRFDWVSGAAAFLDLRRVIGAFALGVLVLTVQDGFPAADRPWAWLVALPAVALFRCPKLLYALVPAILWTHFTVMTSDASYASWPLVWVWVLAAMDAVAVVLLDAQEHPVGKFVQAAVAFLASLLLVKAVSALVGRLDQPSTMLWRTALLWSLGGVLVHALGEVFARTVRRPAVAFIAQLAFLPAFLFFAQPWAWAHASFGPAALILVGLAAVLAGAARFAPKEEPLFSVIQGAYAFAVGAVAFVCLDALPGAGISLFWALVAALVFILGFLLSVRAYRMIGLFGLVVATGHVVLHDVHDILGRIVACAAVAVAFFGVAWLYGKVVKKDGSAT